MNMKKTFAGAMAGALAVSAMATSASAAVPGPGEYTIDLTKEAEFYATVQFTFDGDYMMYDKIENLADGAGNKFLDLIFDNKSASSIFDVYNMKELTVEFVGAAGTTTQKLSYNTTWDNVNFYNWNLFNYVQAVGGSSKAGYTAWVDDANTDAGRYFAIPVASNGVASNAQTLYLNKYSTVADAFSVKTSTGDKKYPIDAATGKSGADTLDYTYFDKITVTAKIPVTKKFSLDELNGVNGYKTKLFAGIGGLYDLNITEVEKATTTEDTAVTAAKKAVDDAQTAVDDAQKAVDDAQKVVDDLNAAKVAAASYDAAVAKVADLTANPVADYTQGGAVTGVTLDKGSVDIDGTTPITFETLAGTEYAVCGDSAVEYDKDSTNDVKAVKEYNDAVTKYNKYVADLKAANDVVAAYTGKTVAEIEAEIEAAKAEVTKLEKALATAEAALTEAKAELKEKEADQKAAQGKTQVEIAAGRDTLIDEDQWGNDWNNTPVVFAETLFTKFESNPVGVKSGVVIDNGVVKTLAADIGAWKPDAVRKIADAIGTNTGVTLTFTAKDAFDDAAFKAWAKDWQTYATGMNLSQGTTTSALYSGWYGTDSAKDDYDVWGESMFTGAIVLNRDFSKQFSQSGVLDWGTSTITFDWDELTEGRFYDAAVVLHSIELLSTQNVEWVSCTVTVPEQEASADDVDSSQGKEDDSNVIDDTPVESEVITEAPVETEAPATEAPATEAPAETTAVAPVDNVKTGNAPVALAVIPVALAAAAIIAKKRG